MQEQRYCSILALVDSSWLLVGNPEGSGSYSGKGGMAIAVLWDHCQSEGNCCTLYNALHFTSIQRVSLWLDCLHKGPWFGHVDAWKIILLENIVLIILFSYEQSMWFLFFLNIVIRERCPYNYQTYIYIEILGYICVCICNCIAPQINVYAIDQLHLISYYIIVFLKNAMKYQNPPNVGNILAITFLLVQY